MFNFKGKSVLVTGGAGFVGSHLVEELIKLKAHIVIIDQVIDPFSYLISKGLHKKVMIIQADVCDFERIFDIVTKFQIQYIFHLAAQPLVEVAYHNPKQTLYTNIIGTINILESSRLYQKIKAVVIASSDKAYGKLGKKKYIETDPLIGDHPYEVSKSSADLISSSYFKTYRVPAVITRFGNIYGQGDLNFSRIIPGIMKALIEKETLDIRSDGKYVREYLYVKDVVKGYLLLAKSIEKVKGQAFNFGSNEVFSVIEIIKYIEKKLRKKVHFRILDIVKNEIPFQMLDFKKVHKEIDWKPKYTLAATINKILNWYTKYYEMQGV